MTVALRGGLSAKGQKRTPPVSALGRAHQGFRNLR